LGIQQKFLSRFRIFIELSDADPPQAGSMTNAPVSRVASLIKLKIKKKYN
jgi:hypothetical protein